MKSRDINNIKVNNTLDEKEIKGDPNKAKENFIKNMDQNKELRLKIWEKVFWDKKTQIKYRNNKQLMIDDAEKEWQSFNEADKSDWYDYVTNDGKALGIVGELNYIVQLVKMHKGNMSKVWKDLKSYGKTKKEGSK